MRIFRKFISPVKPVVISRSTRLLRPHKAISMLEEGNNELVQRVNAQSHALVQLWAKVRENAHE